MSKVISPQRQSRSRFPSSAVAQGRSRLRGKATYYVGLLGLFMVSTVLWAALWVIVPSVWPGWTSVAITSDSMAPSIRRGDIVIAAPHDTRMLEPGSVIVFEDSTGASLLTHRIAGVNEDGTYVTLGDANALPDSTPVHPDQVFGVGRYLVPLFGLPMVWGLEGVWLWLAIWAVTVLVSSVLSRFAFILPNAAQLDG